MYEVVLLRLNAIQDVDHETTLVFSITNGDAHTGIGTVDPLPEEFLALGDDGGLSGQDVMDMEVLILVGYWRLGVAEAGYLDGVEGLGHVVRAVETVPIDLEDWWVYFSGIEMELLEV